MRINRKPALFVDMDGTLAEWRPINVPVQIPSDKINEYIANTLYTEGYYRNLYAYKNMVSAVKEVISEDRMDVYILSCVLPDNPKYPGSSPAADKHAWLDEQFGDMIPKSRRIFVRDGEPKVANIPFPLQTGDMLLDDYTKNLNDWTDNAPEGVTLTAAKVLNPVNDTRRSWKGDRISIIDPPGIIKNKIYSAGIPEIYRDGGGETLDDILDNLAKTIKTLTRTGKEELAGRIRSMMDMSEKMSESGENRMDHEYDDMEK